MAEHGAAPRRRGRPPAAQKAGKLRTVSTRVTEQTKADLEAEASRTGRSISQVAELWIEQGQRDRAFWTERLGGAEVAPILAAAGAWAQIMAQREILAPQGEAMRLVMLWVTVQDEINRAFGGLVWSELGKQFPGHSMEAMQAKDEWLKAAQQHARRLPFALPSAPDELVRENEILFGAAPIPRPEQAVEGEPNAS